LYVVHQEEDAQMKCRLVGFVVCLALAFTPSAFAQGGTTSTISGVVIDTAGGVIPGAEVQVKHNATGLTQSAVSNSEGAFSFPGLNVGTYTVTVTLSSFKTFVANDVVLTSGAPAGVRAVMELGGVEEKIIVSSRSEIIQTQATTVSTTFSTNQITQLPMTSRSAMDFVTFLPGVTTPGGNRQSQINGLPQGLINITLDGVNIQDNTLRSTDGFFAIVSPRLDAIEEVTVTTAAQGADNAQGAVQIKFVTRSGSNSFTGSGYHYYRSDKLNANTWFNNRNAVAKPELLQNQTGVRVGGPIVIPGLFNGRNRAFFFANYEELRQPSDTTRNRLILTEGAQAGNFSYGSQTVNVLSLAAANGQLSSVDPIVAKLLSDIRSATSGGSITPNVDPNMDRFSFNVAVETLRRFPTFRVDYNITDAHRFSSAYNYQYFTDFPDTLNSRDWSFPGFPNQAGQSSERIGFSNTLRSTLSQNLVNEGRVGYSGAPVVFFKEMNVGMFNGPVANQGGFHLVLGNLTTSNNTPLTNAGAVPAPQSRDAQSLLIEDTLNWLKGTHSISTGGSWTQYTLWMKNSAMVPTINFDVVTGDPALGLFSTANFPGASADNLAAARRLYALLTGRVSNVNGDARLDEATGQYSYMGTGTQRARMREAGLFVQDSWRMRPNLTLNLGLRYELQYPFYPLNDSYSTATLDDLCGISGTNPTTRCNLFQPGVLNGRTPRFVNFSKGTYAYETDYDNFAPSAGFAWTLKGESGFAKLLTGEEAVVRAGYTRAFNRNGMNDFSGVYNSNPGIVIQDTDRDINRGNLNNDGLGLPVLFRDASRLNPAAFPTTAAYPLSDVITEDINLIDPNIKVPYADTWTVGLQRSLGRDMAFEARYVGTRARDLWQDRNFNEINIIDNNFLTEFRQAQSNLQAHVAAGCGGTGNPCSFAYRGTGTGTSPLPIFLAYLNAQPAANASNAALYTGTNWTSATLQAFLAARNPNPFSMVSNGNNTGLINSATFRNNAVTAQLPRNFFMANPDLMGGADLTTNSGSSDYHGLQLELRRRLSHGLQFQSSYAFGRAMQSRFETFRRDTFRVRDTGSPGDLTHAFKLSAIYEMPFGRGRRFGSNVNGLVDRIIGGWTVGLNSRIQSGQLIDLGNVRLVGMTAADVQDMFKLRYDDAGKKIWMLPEDVIVETIKAFGVSATSASGFGSLGAPSGRYFAPANGPDCIEVDNGADYGECGVRSLVVTGPMFRQHDISVAKRVDLVGRVNFEFRVEMLNAFNQQNFVPLGGIGSTRANYEVTGLTGTNTSRVIQLVSRINW
jgi:hypothetical protein